MTSNINLATGGPLYVGDDSQGGADIFIGYNMKSAWTVIPSTDCSNCPSAWLNMSAPGVNVDIISSSRFNITIGSGDAYTVLCD